VYARSHASKRHIEPPFFQHTDRIDDRALGYQRILRHCPFGGNKRKKYDIPKSSALHQICRHCQVSDPKTGRQVRRRSSARADDRVQHIRISRRCRIEVKDVLYYVRVLVHIRREHCAGGRQAFRIIFI